MAQQCVFFDALSQPYGELEGVHGVITVFEANSFATIILVQTIRQEPRPFGTAYKRTTEILFIIIT